MLGSDDARKTASLMKDVETLVCTVYTIFSGSSEINPYLSKCCEFQNTMYGLTEF